MLVGNPLVWSRDLAVAGAATGAAAPFFVIWDPSFAVAGGIAGGLSGLFVGPLAAWAFEAGRKWIPLPVLLFAAACGTALWGSVVGAFAGAFADTMAPFYFGEAIPLGFVLGATSGMVFGAGFFFPYLIATVKEWPTWPIVVAAVCAAPFVGYAGAAALMASTFGLWLFALPLLVWGSIALDRSMRPTASPQRAAARSPQTVWSPRSYDPEVLRREARV